MNNRIEELAKQAQKIVGYTDGGYTEIKALDQEKFAELIIQECIQVCENEGYRLSMDTKTEHHRDLAKQCHKICVMIEKQFGVEE